MSECSISTRGELYYSNRKYIVDESVSTIFDKFFEELRNGVVYTSPKHKILDLDRNEFLTPLCPLIWRKTRTEMLKKRTNVTMRGT